MYNGSNLLVIGHLANYQVSALNVSVDPHIGHYNLG